DVVAEAGVDIARMETERHTCPSMEALNVCTSQVVNQGGFGSLADYVFAEESGQLMTYAVGTLDYDWQDDAGQVYRASEPFRSRIALTFRGFGRRAACGAGFGG